MRCLRSFAFLSTLAITSFAALHCGGSTDPKIGNSPDGGPGDGDGGPTVPVPPPIAATGKVDLLLVVDDSSSMSDKANLLATSVGTAIKRLVQPSCVDASGKVVGPSSGGACPGGGTLEFGPVADMHIGVITSSLGSFGGDVCPDTGKFNSHAHLSTAAPGGGSVAGAAQGFLVYGGGGTTDPDALSQDAESLVRGVGQTGCGLEAQLESAYHFLVAPDPWVKVGLDPNNQADFGADVDVDLLQQRAAFLRPDSLVAIVLLTDEDDSSPDPLSVGGQGWAFSATQFPGSTVFRSDGKTTTAPRATSACKSNPGSPDCTSCGFAATCNVADTLCQRIKSDPECQKNGGYYGPTEDQLNVRYMRMKERFGIDPQYPVERYIDAFSKPTVPDRNSEHPTTTNGGRRTIGAYDPKPKCTNPLFAASLPKAPGDELCNLPRGGRREDLILFGLIGGVPRQLVDGGAQWNKILGASPGDFNYEGIDTHMIQSIQPRAGLPAPSATAGDNGTDPINGREWDTQNDDLQYACTFDLPTPRTCSANDPSCDCAGFKNPPLCSTSPSTQVRGKAYPTVRELRVARALGDRAVVGSICALDGAVAYKPSLNALVDRMAPHLLK